VTGLAKLVALKQTLLTIPDRFIHQSEFEGALSAVIAGKND